MFLALYSSMSNELYISRTKIELSFKIRFQSSVVKQSELLILFKSWFPPDFSLLQKYVHRLKLKYEKFLMNGNR